MPSLDSLNTLKTLQVADRTYHYYSLVEAGRKLGDLQHLPMSLKVLLENLLRWEDGKTVTGDDNQPVSSLVLQCADAVAMKILESLLDV